MLTPACLSLLKPNNFAAMHPCLSLLKPDNFHAAMHPYPSLLKPDTCHAAMHPLLARLWSHTRDAKVREALVLYLRLQLQLGRVQTCQHLAHIGELVTKEVDKPGFSWLGGGPRPAVSRQQAAFLQLCAEVEFRALQRGQSGLDASADGDGEHAFT